MPPSEAALRRAGPWAVLAALCLAAAGPAGAQQLIGPAKCTGCHDHDRQTSRWQKEEPALFRGKAHANALKLLDDGRSAGFAKAIGLPDPYDLKGSCVKCHATVFRGDANAGVSCESCHGASSGYLEIHQVKGSYLKAVAAGMRDLRGKPAVIAALCVDCHLTTDKRLVTAGHPPGREFDAGASLSKIVHWSAAYDYAQVSAESRSAVLRSGGRPGSSAPATPVTPKPVASASLATPAAGQRTASLPPTTSPAASARVAEPDPWDWDQPVRPLPKDYVPEPVGSPSPLPLPPAPAVSPGKLPLVAASSPPTPEPPANVPAPPPPPRRAPEVLPRSIAEEPPLLGVPGASTLTPAVAAPVRAQATLGGRPPIGAIAEVRGRGVVLLGRLLRSGARAPQMPGPARPSEFRGPDSELLRLQDEVLALALEALRRPQ